MNYGSSPSGESTASCTDDKRKAARLCGTDSYYSVEAERTFMPDIFISHSTRDTAFAESIHRFMENQGVSVFRAPFSIAPGQNWTAQIKENLKNSKIVLFLASEAACNSPFVQQELGGAFFADKRIVPVVWEIAPEQLPGWISQSQAVDISNKTVDEIRAAFSAIAGRIRIDKRNALIAAAALIAGFLLLSQGS